MTIIFRPAFALAMWAVLFGAAPLHLASAADRAGQDVGGVEAVVATAEAKRADQVRRLAPEDPLFAGERLETGPQARLHAALKDGGVLMLGAEAAIDLDRFILDPGAAGAELRVVRGAFRMISGEVNKDLGGSMTIRTPLATIGVRGTDFWGLQQPDSLLMALIDDGELSITLPTGTIVLTHPMTLMRFERGQALPTLERLTPEALEGAMSTVALPE